MKVDRRQTLRRLGGFMAGAPLMTQQPRQGAPAARLAPVGELVNVPEFEAMAELVLSPDRFTTISGGHRGSFDRMTLRQRLMVYAMDLDLTTQLFGYDMFAPILVGPVGHQRELHADGELATARGASAAKTVMVASRQSSYPIDQIVADSSAPVWYQVYAEGDIGATRDDVAQAVDAGCSVLCVTVGVSSLQTPVRTDWRAVEQLGQAAGVPVVVKGIMSPNDAETALQHGAEGVVVSSHGGLVTGDGALPIDVLPAVADAVNGRVPVLVDGSFRRGTDILKGLALGATAVMLGRPPMWGLAAYGASGVQTVLELLQTDLARNMAMTGRPTIDMIDRELVRIDSR
ncbi:MAG: alpha-hydroxy-acid oxidizing protein [Acidobacteria bacterium]|nr:alpha-hydroxy-acid oxidizing protein [Acidobacteriota bacterium]